MNLSGAYSSIVVKISIFVNEMSIKEEINILEPENVKLAFICIKNLIIGNILILLYMIPAFLFNSIMMYYF